MAGKILARSGRVAIRRFRRRDVRERMQWPPYADPVLEHLNYRLSTLLERERWILTRLTNAGRMYFAVEDENGSLIGETSLREIDPRARTSRLGIHLASDKRGMGYGREAMEALLDYYFNDMRYEVMFLDVAAHNTRALKLYESLQFEHLGPFWRIERRNLPVFSDERFADIRKHFRVRGGTVECKFHDMRLARGDYLRRTQGAAKSAEEPECYSAKHESDGD